MHKLLLASGLILVVAPAVAQHSVHIQRHRLQGSSTPAAKQTTVLAAGKVTLPDGKPAGGALVYLSWTTQNGEDKFQKSVADANGTFQQKVTVLASTPGFAVTAFLPDRGFFWRTVSIRDKGQGKSVFHLDLPLEPTTTLTGRLVRLNGQAAAGVAVRIQTLTPAVSSEINAEAEQQTVSMSEFLPEEEEIKTLRPAMTDASGRFTLTGLPRQGQMSLTLGNSLALAPGSLESILLQSRDRQDLGFLVAAKLGRVKVRVLNSADGKPAPGVDVQIVSSDVTPAMRMGRMVAQQQFHDIVSNLASQANTDQKGEAVSQGLMPGNYTVVVQGRACSVRVEEGQDSAPVTVTLRQGPLKGRILDTNGKPVAKLAITMVPDLSLHDGPQFLNEGFQQAQTMANFQQQPVAQTAADGTFEIQDFPWGSASVILRAVRGNDLAEWRGAPAKIGANLNLRLRPALVSVTGRLLDPQRHPLTLANFQTLHWQDSPRITWFATAHQVRADKLGHFRVDGLERGESFSMVTAGVQAQQAGLESQQFESPRFETPTAGLVQDLGDIVVHPVQGQEEILQIYGAEPQGEIANLSGFLPTPSQEEVTEARQILAQYHHALNAGDLGAMQQMTSHASPGWSERREQFLLHASLRTAEDDPAAANTLHALAFVPRVAPAVLLQLGVDQETRFGQMGAAARDLEVNPHWVFLAEKHGNAVGIAGILRKEEGQWRVINLSETAVEGVQQVLSFNAVLVLDTDSFTRLAPALDAATLEDARQVGTHYLSVWFQGRRATMQALTSPLSATFTADFEEFKKRLAQRPDEGSCPLSTDTGIALQPVENLSLWEQELLINNVGATSRSRAIEQMETQRAFIKRGDIALFRYSASSGDFLMILARYDGKWQVVEPAMPL